MLIGQIQSVRKKYIIIIISKGEMFMTKRIMLSLLIVIVAMSVLVSCGNDYQSETDTEAKTADRDSIALNTDPASIGSEAPSDSETEPVASADDEPEEIYVTLRFGGKYFAQIRKAAWLEDFDLGINFNYLGEIGETLDDDSEIIGSSVPVGTPVYLSEDGACARVAFGGVVYYCNLADEPTPPETDENGNIVTEAPGPGCFAAVLNYKDGHYWNDHSFKGIQWSFELDGDWRFVGLIRSVVSLNIYPEYDLEASFDYLGKPVYYNEKLDRVAILVEDDNFAYSDIDWEILSRCTE